MLGGSDRRFVSQSPSQTTSAVHTEANGEVRAAAGALPTEVSCQVDFAVALSELTWQLGLGDAV